MAVGLALPYVQFGPTVMGVREFRVFILACAGITLVLVSLADNWPMRLFGAWCGVLFALNNSMAAMITVIMLVIGFALYALGSLVKPAVWFDALLIFVLIQTVYQFAQYFGFDPLFTAKAAHGGSELHVGLTGNRNVIGGLQALAVPLALRKGRLLSLAVLVPGLAISDTATAALAALAACGVMLWMEYRHRDGRFFLLVGLIMLAGLTAGYLQVFDKWDVLTNDRWTVWGRAWAGIKASPWLGYGLGSFKSAGIVEGGVFFRSAHNEFVQLAFETGAPGLVLALAFVAQCALKLRKASTAAGGMFAALVVLALGSFPLHTADLAVWSVPFLGMLSREDC